MGTPKAGIVLADGKTMIEHVYDALRQVCDRIVLVGHAEGVPDSLKHLTQLHDHYLFCGPMGALETLLSSNEDYEYLITPCDLAGVVPAVYRPLAEEASAPALLMPNDLIEHLIARYSVRELPIVRRLLENKMFAMRHLTEITRARRISVPEHLHHALHNINTPADLI